MNAKANILRAFYVFAVVAVLSMHNKTGLCQPVSKDIDDTYATLGPKETASFEQGLHKLGANVCGVWPRLEKLATAEKPLEYWINFDKDWLSKVLKSDIKAKDDAWNTENWIMVPELRPIGNDYLLGRFIPASNKLQGNVEFQASDRNITLLLNSPTLFGHTDLDDAEIRKLVVRVLNIPSEDVAELKIQQHTAVIGDDKTPICYGGITWRYAFRGDWANDKDREWWSFIPFWIAKDQLCIQFSTVDWKGLGPSQFKRSILNLEYKIK